MESFEPLINLLTLLTMLSMLAERATNFQKLRHDDLRIKKTKPEEEKDREYQITKRTMLTGIALAILVKADMFAIVGQLDAP